MGEENQLIFLHIIAKYTHEKELYAFLCIAEESGQMQPSRLEAISKLIQQHPVANQRELKKALDQMGFVTTQASISRDLKRLGIIKQGGYYKPRAIEPGESMVVEWLDAGFAGDHLIVMKMAPGQASRAAFLIDGARIPGAMGCIAGDDTIFVAVKDKKAQGQVLKAILDMFSRS